MNESLLQKLRRVQLGDIRHFLLFLLALLPAAVYRRRRAHLWLVCEYANEAQDNGYALFRHLRINHPEVDAVYAIKHRSDSFKTVAALGPTIEFGSFRHWIYYLAAEVNISSQKGGKPNAAVCYLFEVVLGWLKNRRVFLQHGITKDDLPFLHAKAAKLSLFCCAAQPEYEFIRDTFGYPEGVVQLLGFCRHDALIGAEPDPDLLLILPTWRMWLERTCRSSEEFSESQYYQNWQALLNDSDLDQVLEQSGKRAVFCVHRNMMRFETCFKTASKRIEVRKWDEVSIPALIKQAALLITDYSSVGMDFAFMERPIIYYQFDHDAFRQGHLPAGYFDYRRDGFGPVTETVRETVKALSEQMKDGGRMAPTYSERVRSFYPFRDTFNSERTTTAIKEMLER